VKPTYKAGWDLPGGYFEPGESPRQAAHREVREELGIDAEIGRLLVVDWAPHPNEGDKLLFILEGGDQHPDNPRPTARNEIERVQFWPVEHLDRALPSRLHGRITNGLHIGKDVYLEHGAAAKAPTQIRN
jgi:8-oxo-dGTP pyrophosphatase MutT (NUDIX family)